MRAYVLKRILLMVPTLLIVLIVTFGVVNAMPGDAITARLLESPSFNPADLAEKREALGLNDPVYVQYWSWLSDVLRGDFGDSLWSEQPVTNLVKDAAPVTAELAILAFILSITLALIVGVPLLPSVVLCSPGLVSAIGLLIVQGKLWLSV